MNESDVRKHLERSLGRQVEDSQWEALKSEGYVNEVSDEAAEIEYLKNKFKLFWPGQAVKRPQLKITTKAEKPSEGVFNLGGAISSLFAWHAHGDKEVQAFRKEIIGKEMGEVFGRPEEICLLNWKPYTPEMLAAWKNKGEELTQEEIELHDAFTVEAWVNRQNKEERSEGLPLAQGEEGEVFFLEYGVPSEPGDNGWRTVPVTPGKVLDKLRLLSERLAKQYKWTIPEATLFVLTGGTPWVSRIAASFDLNEKFPAGSRINLSIDPMLPPEKVSAFYKKCRKEFLTKPVREPRPKAVALASFAAASEIKNMKEQIDPKRLTWEEKRCSWNSTYGKYFPDMKYEASQLSNFIRDYKRAKEKLLNPPTPKFENLIQKFQWYFRNFYDRPFDEIEEGD